jgi:lipopolysaccharide heptosyltransferase I
VVEGARLESECTLKRCTAGSNPALSAILTPGIPTVSTADPKRILIIRLSAIGDVVRVLPAAAALRKAYPQARIDWIVDSRSADIIKGSPVLDEVYVLRRGRGVVPTAISYLKAREWLGRRTYDLAFDFHGTERSALLLRMSRATIRIGFAPPRSHPLVYLAATDRVRLPEPIMNRVDENRALVSRWCDVSSVTDLSSLIDKQIDAKAYESVMSRRTGRPYLALVHPAVDRKKKAWPNERFVQLIDRLQADDRFDVVLSYGPGQRDMVEPIASACRERPNLIEPCKSLRAFADVVSNVSVFIGVDTGPMHIAALVGTPVVAIFGGTDPQMHAPVGAPCRALGGVVLRHRKERATAKQSLAALETVKVDAVFEATVELLAVVDSDSATTEAGS